MCWGRNSSEKTIQWTCDPVLVGVEHGERRRERQGGPRQAPTQQGGGRFAKLPPAGVIGARNMPIATKPSDATNSTMKLWPMNGRCAKSLAAALDGTSPARCAAR